LSSFKRELRERLSLSLHLVKTMKMKSMIMKTKRKLEMMELTTAFLSRRISSVRFSFSNTISMKLLKMILLNTRKKAMKSKKTFKK
jgi:hypothetical protein